MADTKLNLDFLPPEKREFLRRRAAERGSTIREELERTLAEAMAGSEEDEDDNVAEEAPRPHRPIDDFVSSHTPESLERAREADRRLNERLKRRRSEGEGARDLSNIIGIVRGDGTVTGRNFHEYLYGQDDDDR